MRSAFDFTPYRNSWIGFDHLFDMLEQTEQGDANGFPPFDLEQIGENAFRLRLAVAGFTGEDIEITARSNLLVVAGNRADEPDRTWLYRGIGKPAFERTFQLADYVVVTGARLSDGLLEIELERQIPDEIKPRKIEVTTDRPRIEDADARRRTRGEAASRNGKSQTSKGEAASDSAGRETASVG